MDVAELEGLSRSKSIHFVLVSAGVMLAVAGAFFDESWMGVYVVPFVTFWIGGLVTGPGETSHGWLVGPTVAALAGCASFVGVFLLAVL